MNKIPVLLVLAALLGGATAGAAPQHDLYLFGSINGTGRVIGSRDNAMNGVYRRTAAGD